MKEINKRIIAVWLLVMVFLLPFCTLTHYYPFMRFGMFARKPDLTKRTGYFELNYRTAKTVSKIKPESFCFTEGGFSKFIETNLTTQNDLESFRLNVLAPKLGIQVDSIWIEQKTF